MCVDFFLQEVKFTQNKGSSAEIFINYGGVYVFSFVSCTKMGEFDQSFDVFCFHIYDIMTKLEYESSSPCQSRLPSLKNQSRIGNSQVSIFEWGIGETLREV